jgi:hypothetical protein
LQWAVPASALQPPSELENRLSHPKSLEARTPAHIASKDGAAVDRDPRNQPTSHRSEQTQITPRSTSLEKGKLLRILAPTYPRAGPRHSNGRSGDRPWPSM